MPVNPEPIPHNMISLSSLVLTPTITLYIKVINAMNKIVATIILKIISYTNLISTSCGLFSNVNSGKESFDNLIPKGA